MELYAEPAPAPPPPLLLVAFDRAVREPLRPVERKGLDSEVMTILGIRQSAPLAPSVKSPFCERDKDGDLKQMRASDELLIAEHAIVNQSRINDCAK